MAFPIYFANKRFSSLYIQKNIYRILLSISIYIEVVSIDKKRNYLFSNNPTLDMAKLALLYYPESEYPFFSFQEDDETTNLDKLD